MGYGGRKGGLNPPQNDSRRPPRIGGSWNPIASNGWGMLEFLQFREAARIPLVVLDLSVGIPLGC